MFASIALLGVTVCIQTRCSKRTRATCLDKWIILQFNKKSLEHKKAALRLTSAREHAAGSVTAVWVEQQLWQGDGVNLGIIHLVMTVELIIELIMDGPAC